MRNEFTAVVEQEGEWFAGFSIPEANGQGHSVGECRENLEQATSLVLQDRRQDAHRGVPPEAANPGRGGGFDSRRSPPEPIGLEESNRDPSDWSD